MPVCTRAQSEWRIEADLPSCWVEVGGSVSDCDGDRRTQRERIRTDDDDPWLW